MKGKILTAIFTIFCLFTPYTGEADPGANWAEGLHLDAEYREVPSMSTRESESVSTYLYKQLDGNHVTASIIKSGDYFVFSLSEGGQTVFEFNPQHKSYSMYRNSIQCINCKGKRFYSFTAQYDNINKIPGRSVLVGYDPTTKKYRIYVDSKDYYSPWPDTNWPGIVISKNIFFDGTPILVLSQVQDFHTYYEGYSYKLNYNPQNDTFSYELLPVTRIDVDTD